MKFYPAVIGDLGVRVLLLRPDISQARGRTIRIAHKLDTTIGESRTTIEERRPARSALLLTQSVTFRAKGAAVDDWRKGLAALGPTLIAMPLWIDALPVSLWSRRIYEPGKMINFDPNSGGFIIYDASGLPAVPTYSHYAPLLIGRWSKRPPANALTSQAADIDVTLVEASPWSCRIGVRSQAGGWTQKPNWKDAPVDVSDYGLEQIALDGVAAREVGLDRVNAAHRWRQEGGFLFTSRESIRQHLTHFVAMRGAWSTWPDLPAWLQPGTPTSDTPDTYTARFAQDTLTLDYIAGNAARTKIAFIQEVNTPGRDQAQPGETYLYQLVYSLDPANPELWTNWDEPLVTAEGTYQPAQLAHQEIVRSAKPQNVKAEFAMAFAAGSLMDDWQNARLFGPVAVTVWKCDPADPDGTRGDPIIDGEVTSVLPEGNTLRVTMKPKNGFFDSQMPGWEFGMDCNTHVFSEECTLARAAYLSSGTIARTDLASDRVTITVHGATGWGGPAYPDNWFANGQITTGTGRATMVATIMTSTTSGGNLVLTLQRELWADLIGAGSQSCELEPGCGGQYQGDCIDKFGNGDNFCGYPFAPDYLEQRDPGATPTPKK